MKKKHEIKDLWRDERKKKYKFDPIEHEDEVISCFRSSHKQVDICLEQCLSFEFSITREQIIKMIRNKFNMCNASFKRCSFIEGFECRPLDEGDLEFLVESFFRKRQKRRDSGENIGIDYE